MELEFEKYVERRETIDAVQFLDVKQAEWFARKLSGGMDLGWTLAQKNDSFTLTVGGYKMHRGDYLVRSKGIPPRYSVVLFSDFRKAWQKPEWPGGAE